MKNEIEHKITRSNEGIVRADIFYVIDEKNLNDGLVSIKEEEPAIGYVLIQNPNQIEVQYFAFHDNALQVDGEAGQVEQCECVLFPSSQEDNCWILFIEVKYTANLKSALSPEHDYPNKTINQIISTVDYFRENNLIPQNKRVHALVHFPNVLEHLSEAFITRSTLTIEEILEEHKILLRISEKAEIKSFKRIKI